MKEVKKKRSKMLLLFLDLLQFLLSKIMNIGVVYITDIPISHLMSLFVQMETDFFLFFLRVAHDLLVNRYLLFLICDVVKTP